MGLQSFYYQLPYGFRRTLYSTFSKSQFQTLQDKRINITDAGYTFKPFDDNKCIFVHIPKAAGVSVCKSLFGNLAGGHVSVKRYQVIFSEQEFDAYFKFTFVRNPWSRLYSAYTFLKKGGMNESDKKWGMENLADYDSFDQFVKGWVTPENVRTYIHFIPQTDFLCLPGQNKLLVDFVGYFENIENDFTFVKEKLRLASGANLGYENKTEAGGVQSNYMDFYTEDSQRIVAEVYGKDVELLGYSFDNSSLANQLAKRSCTF